MATCGCTFGTPDTAHDILIADRELATLLHALRIQQETMTPFNEPCTVGTCEHFADKTALTADEIDSLCERLNLVPRPRLSSTQEAIVHIQRAITLLQHDPDAIYALASMIPGVVIRATERGETIDPLLGA